MLSERHAIKNAQLVIETGLYAGVSRHLDVGRHIVGHGEAADVALIEDSLSLRHFALNVGADGGVGVEAIDAEIEVDGEMLAPGATLALAGETFIRAGEVTFRTVSRVPAKTTRPANKALRLAAMLALFLASGMLLVEPFFVSPQRATDSAGRPMQASNVLSANAAGQTGSVNAAAMSSVSPSNGPIGPLSGSIQSPEAVSATGDSGSERLKLELSAQFPTLQVDAAGDVVTVRGTINPDIMERWRAAMRRADEQFGSAVTLVNLVDMKADKAVATPAIEAVWSGDNPYIIVRGERYFPGARLEGGWTFARLESGRVVLERNGALVAVVF